MIENHQWRDWKNDPPEPGQTVLVYLEKPHHESRIAIWYSTKTSDGYLNIINGLFSWDFSGNILCWHPLDEIEQMVPLRYEECDSYMTSTDT